MDLITYNPYRTLGVLSNASEREILKQKNKLNMLASLGQTASFDYDLPAFGYLPRSASTIQDAYSQIEQPKQKVLHALFWFCNADSIDEIALNHLKQGSPEKARDIWERSLSSGNITSRTHSSAANLATLLLWQSMQQQQINIHVFQTAIQLKQKAIVSDFSPDFVNRIAGNNVVIDHEELLFEFLKKVVERTKAFQTSNQLSPIKLIEIFRDFPDSSREYLIETLSTAPLNNIEKRITETKNNRSKNPGDGEIYGEKLYVDTKDDLLFLRQALSLQDVQYQQVANKVAEEIRLCVYDFFTEYKDSDSYDPGDTALAVAKMARNVGPTGQYKSRISEMIESLEEWVEAQPERERQKLLQEPITFITQKLERFQEADDSIPVAKALLTSCEPKLRKIREIVGSTDDLYLQISNAIAGNAMGMLVTYINEEQEGIQYNIAALNEFGYKTAAALEVQKSLTRFDLTADMRQRVQTNLTALKQLHMPFVNTKRQQLSHAQAEMNKIMEWQFGRTQSEKNQQISRQNAVINRIKQELKILEDALH